MDKIKLLLQIWFNEMANSMLSDLNYIKLIILFIFEPITYVDSLLLLLLIAGYILLRVDSFECQKAAFKSFAFVKIKCYLYF